MKQVALPLSPSRPAEQPSRLLRKMHAVAVRDSPVLGAGLRAGFTAARVSMVRPLKVRGPPQPSSRGWERKCAPLGRSPPSQAWISPATADLGLPGGAGLKGA